MTYVLSETGVWTASAIIARLTRWIGIASLILSAVILAAATDERFSLPECDSARATDSLRELAGAARIERAAVVEPQSLRSGSDEKFCKATLALNEGAAIGVRYRFYWDGWTQKIEFTDADE
jgi:hypothetical protein